jgi:hypothetical protein
LCGGLSALRAHHAKKSWGAMNDNYEARVKDPKQSEPIFAVFSRVLLHAWEEREAASRQYDKPLELPRIVSEIRNKLAHMKSILSQQSNMDQPSCAVAINIDESPMPMPLEDNISQVLGMGATLAYPGRLQWTSTWTSSGIR